MNVSHKMQYHGVSLENKIPLGEEQGGRINNEISYAIKRQRETSGVDYFKQTMPLRVPVNTERRGFSNKIQNLNLDGATLPQFSISSQLKTDKNHGRNSRKFSKFGTLNRSKSSLSLPLSSARHGITPQTSPHNVVLTDLTCLQLADTLFSSNLSLGFTSHNTDKLKYTTFIGEKKSFVKSESEKSVIAQLKHCSSLPILHGLPDTNPSSRKSLPHATSYTKRDSIRPSSANHLKRRTSQDKEAPKSILKQNFLDTQTDDSFRRARYRTLSDRDSRAKNPEQSKSIVIRASKIGIQSTDRLVKPCTVNYDEKGKRSVRFNAAHEVIEYTPYEPVCN